ncbi:MAG: hypothetical protein LBR72_02255, partial [Oscillospiraceae bacterium]|nr:hypothetical protein [Oscillospiraceae bacterium]
MDRFVSGGPAARTLRKELRAIERTAARAAEWNGGSRLLPGEMEWLLDNRYLCRREGKDAERLIRGAKRLPAGEKGPAALLYAERFLEQTNGEVTEEGLGAFLKERAFSEREYWLFVPLLKAALIGRIAASCREIDNVLASYRKTEGDSPFTAEAKAFAARSAGKLPDR